MDLTSTPFDISIQFSSWVITSFRDHPSNNIGYVIYANLTYFSNISNVPSSKWPKVKLPKPDDLPFTEIWQSCTLIWLRYLRLFSYTYVNGLKQKSLIRCPWTFGKLDWVRPSHICYESTEIGSHAGPCSFWQLEILGYKITNWWVQPSWKILILVNGKDYPIYYGKIKNVPNHQPDNIIIYNPFLFLQGAWISPWCSPPPNFQPIPVDAVLVNPTVYSILATNQKKQIINISIPHQPRGQFDYI